MKQFLTLCMAAAMIGTAAAAPKVSLREALQMKSEGKAIQVQGKVRQNGVTPIRTKPVSAFHKIQAEKEAGMEKAPAKAMANGDAIYGNLTYTEGDGEPGFYELVGGAGEFLWTNEFAAAGASLSYDPEAECLKGYYPDIFWGMLFGVYYVEMDLETGEITKLEEQDSSIDGYMQVAALDDEGYFYGFGGIEGVAGLIKAPAEDPFNYEYVASTTFCNGICYNQDKGIFFGVDNNGNMVEITKDGDVTVVDNVYASVPDFYPYIGGMVYNAASGVYYWNGQQEMSSGMYTINPDTYEITLLEMCPYSDEYNSLVTTDFKVTPGLPNAPVAGTAYFRNASTTGTVTFTLPTTLKEGTAIEGRIKYNAYLDGQLYTTGSQNPGVEITVPFTVDNDDPIQGQSHTFGLVAIVNGVPSKMTTVRYWVGNDNPLNPTNVVLTAESLTWDAVPTGKEGVHGGYVEPGAVTYKAYLNYTGAEGEKPFYTGAACECDPGFDPEDLVESYKATVIAVCNTMESVNSVSNSIVTGAPYSLPITFQPTPAEFAVSTVLDGNGSYGFQLGSDANGYFVQCGYTNSKDVPMDAWYILPPVAIEDVNKFYTFSVDVNYRSNNYPEEAFEVLLLNEPTMNGVVGTIIDYTSLESTVPTTFTGLIGGKYLRQPGTYYVALHCVSDGDQLGIQARNFSIEDNNICLDSPAEAGYLSAEETAKGELSANVEFQFPTKTLGGQDLAADATLKATVSSSVDAVTITGKPGVKVANTKVMTVQGVNEISVVVTNAEGYNSPKATTEVYTGVTVPATPTNLQAEGSRTNMSLTLTWDKVTTPDDEDGIIDPEDVSYIIYGLVQSLFGSYWNPIAYSDTNSYTYTAAEDAEQDFIALGVGSQNAAGTNGYLLYVQDNVGTPYTLPMNEDFDPSGFQTQPWIIWTFNDVEAPEWSVYEMSALYEGEAGGFLGATGVEGAMGMLAMPRFSTWTDHETIRVTFDLNAEFELPTTTVLGRIFGMGEDEYIEVGELTVEAGEGWKQAYVDLPAEMLNQFWAQLYIQVEFSGNNQLLAISNVSVDCPTGVASIAGEGIHISAGKNMIAVSGLNGQNVVVSTLDGKIAAKKANVSDATFNVEKGIYVVKAGDKNAKVVVK